MDIVKEMTEAGSDGEDSDNNKQEEPQSNGAKDSSDDNLVVWVNRYYTYQKASNRI